MTAARWLLLALTLLLVPLGSPVAERVHVLAVRGRLRIPGTHAARWRPAKLSISVPIVGAVALAVVTVRAGPLLGAAAGSAAAATASLVQTALRARAAERSAAKLLAAARVMVAEVAAGAHPDAALRAAGEVDPARAAVYARAADAVRSGADAGLALATEPALVGIGSAWSVATASGAPVGAVLERVVADLVARREQARSVTAALAGPRSSAVVLAVLPVLGVLLGLAMDADPLGFLFGSPTGQLVCLIGVALDLAGLFWTRRLAASAASP